MGVRPGGRGAATGVGPWATLGHPGLLDKSLRAMPAPGQQWPRLAPHIMPALLSLAVRAAKLPTNPFPPNQPSSPPLPTPPWIHPTAMALRCLWPMLWARLWAAGSGASSSGLRDTTPSVPKRRAAAATINLAASFWGTCVGPVFSGPVAGRWCLFRVAAAKK